MSVSKHGSNTIFACMLFFFIRMGKSIDKGWWSSKVTTFAETFSRIWALKLWRNYDDTGKSPPSVMQEDGRTGPTTLQLKSIALFWYVRLHWMDLVVILNIDRHHFQFKLDSHGLVCVVWNIERWHRSVLNIRYVLRHANSILVFPYYDMPDHVGVSIVKHELFWK